MIGKAILAAAAATIVATGAQAKPQLPPPVLAPAPSLSPEEEGRLADALGQCVTLKTTGEDRLLTARWFVAALASAPQIADVATVSPERKTELDRGVARLFTRLLTVDCASDARPLFRARSHVGMEKAGEMLGRIAMQELMGNSAATAAMFGGYASQLNPRDFDVLSR